MRTSTWMLLGCLLACNLSAHADGSGTERFRTLTVETVYPFKQTDFDPPVALAAHKQSRGKQTGVPLCQTAQRAHQ